MFIYANVALCTIVIRHNVLELTVNSTRVIQGTITSQESKTSVNGMIVTEIKMMVSDTLKGKHEDDATFLVPGGKLPNGLVCKIAGTPTFRSGEEVIVFLEGSKANIVTGFAQGKFQIQTEVNQTKSENTYAVQNTKGLCMLDARGPQKGEEGGPVTNWGITFSSDLTKATSQLKAGNKNLKNGSCNHGDSGEYIHGNFLKVPLSIFKQTIRECNFDNNKK